MIQLSGVGLQILRTGRTIACYCLHNSGATAGRKATAPEAGMTAVKTVSKEGSTKAESTSVSAAGSASSSNSKHASVHAAVLPTRRSWLQHHRASALPASPPPLPQPLRHERNTRAEHENWVKNNAISSRLVLLLACTLNAGCNSNRFIIATIPHTLAVNAG